VRKHIARSRTRLSTQQSLTTHPKHLGQMRHGTAQARALWLPDAGGRDRGRYRYLTGIAVLGNDTN
jgi:hypothetical protein